MDSTTDFSSEWPLPFRLRSRRLSIQFESEEAYQIPRAVAGDDEAFVLLVERHQDKIFRFCCQWLSSTEDAREVTQDTFVRAYLAIDRYKTRGRFSTWLFQIALNLCRDRLKSKSGRQAQQTDSWMESGTEKELPCPSPAPDEIAARSGDQARLDQAIAQLPMSLRAVVIICGVEGMSQETCAEILNLTVRAVEGRFYRARRQLESLLSEESE